MSVEIDSLLGFRYNVLSLAIIEDLTKNEVLIEVENVGVPFFSVKVKDVLDVIKFYDHVMVHSHTTIRKLVVSAAIPLCGNLIKNARNLQQLYVKLISRSKFEQRKMRLNLNYPIDINSHNIRSLSELKGMRTLALFTYAQFTLKEILENKVCRLELCKNGLQIKDLNKFVRKWIEGKVESESFRVLVIMLNRNFKRELLFENVQYKKINDVEETMEEVMSKYYTKRHIDYYRVSAANKRNYMKIKFSERRIEFEMF